MEKTRILLVDDAPGSLLALKAALDRPEYELMPASSGEEALEAVLRHEFAAVVLDISLPGMNGFEVATLIRQRIKTRRLPIIFVTGVMKEARDIYRGYRTGAVDYLLKPVDTDALRAKVAVFVDLFRQEQQINRTAQALAASEHRERMLAEALYEVTFEEAPIGIGHASTNGRWTRANPRLAEILGREREEIPALRIEDVVDDRDRAELSARIADVLAGRVPRHRGEYRFRRPSGEAVWIVTMISMIQDASGSPVQLTIMEDVTEEKRLSAALVESERRFLRLWEAGLIGMFYQDDDGAILDANDAFLRMLHYRRDDLRSGALTRRILTPPQFQATEERARKGVDHSGAYPAYETEFLRGDGGRVAVLIGGVKIEGGEIGFALDITDRKELERDRARRVRELRKSIRARDDFLSVAAHELRNPITPLLVQVTSLAGLARRNEGPVQRQWLLQQLEPMERSTRRLTRLVDTLLDASRLTVGHLRLDLEDVDLVAVIRDVLERMREEIDRSGCKVTLASGEPSVGKWDRGRLDQVVTNLFSNALKYGAGRPIEIRVDGSRKTARLTIRDHGIGIGPEDRERLFERFERYAPVRHYGGFGLGLWVVRQVVEALGGNIDVWSEKGEGARFTVALPRRQPSISAAPRPSDAPARGEETLEDGAREEGSSEEGTERWLTPETI